MDYIFNTKAPLEDLKSDWYMLHAMLSNLLGSRVVGETTRWTFSPDPRIEDVIIVRTSDDEIMELAGDTFPYAMETYVPKQGDTVNFAVLVSGRSGRPGRRQTLQDIAAQRLEDKSLHTSKLLDHPEGQKARVIKLLGNAGLTDVDVQSLKDGQYRIIKHREGFEKRALILGIQAIGTAKVHDLEALKPALNKGLGRDKAFGFGTLILSRHKKGA